MAPELSQFQEDQLRKDFYKEFYQANQELFKNDPLEYHQKASIYVETKIREEKLKKGELEKKVDGE